MVQLDHIIVVGAGPAGLVLALLLGNKGIRVTVVEREAKPPVDSRAVFYQPISQFEFERAGILQDVQNAALPLGCVAFSDLDGNRLFEMPGPGHLILNPRELHHIVHTHVKHLENVELLWGTEVVDVGQTGAGAWVDVITAHGSSDRLLASYVVGCDGGQSTVREKAFGKGVMEGFTWDKRLIAADIECDFAEGDQVFEDSNLFVHSQTPCLLFRTSKTPGRWRFIYNDGETPSVTRLTRTGDTLLHRVSRCRGGLHYKVTDIRQYKVHQRLSERMRQGRIVLASDAAHLCCPYGALGLNGGIADVGSLYDCLVAINEGRANNSILDVYERVRREKWQTLINPQSQAMLKTVYSDPQDIVPDHPMYKMSLALKSDPQSAALKAPDPLALRYDFSEQLNEEY